MQIIHENPGKSRRGKGKSLTQCLRDRPDYVQNPEKTEKGGMVTSYECDPMTCDEEFLLSKQQYEFGISIRSAGIFRLLRLDFLYQ